jgi:HD-GYP domain-containing protein (c-di-GMP phosphodiesterase class II)
MTKEQGRNLYPVPLRLFSPGQAPPCRIYRQSHAGTGAGEGAPMDGPADHVFVPSPGGGETAWGYFDLSETGLLLNYLSARLQDEVAGDGLATLEEARFLYDLTLIWTQHIFQGDPESPAPDQLHLAKILMARLHHLIKGVERPREVFLGVRRHDSGLFTHSVNVCMLGMAFVQYLGWPQQEAEIFGLGALLHDIGMAFLPRSTWTKTAPLTTEEQEAIKTHPQRGVKFLENFSDLPGTVFFMVAQHHESDDGAGYPLGLPRQAIHPWARLLKLLDTYEAMTSIRPWRAPLSSPKALKVLEHSVGAGSSPPALLASLGEFWGRAEPDGP